MSLLRNPGSEMHWDMNCWEIQCKPGTESMNSRTWRGSWVNRENELLACDYEFINQSIQTSTVYNQCQTVKQETKALQAFPSLGDNQSHLFYHFKSCFKIIYSGLTKIVPYSQKDIEMEILESWVSLYRGENRTIFYCWVTLLVHQSFTCHIINLCRDKNSVCILGLTWTQKRSSLCLQRPGEHHHRQPTLYLMKITVYTVSMCSA